MIEKKTLTCIECPIGCSIEVSLENSKPVNVVGNRCPRGKLYAENEVTCPKRVVTAVVRATDGRMVPVKTDAPVRKSAIFDVMKTINLTHPAPPLKIGDVLVEHIDGDANLVATGILKIE